MTLIVDKDIKKIIITRTGATSAEEKTYHAQSDVNIAFIKYEEIKTEEQNEN